MSVITELIELHKKYEDLKYKYKKQGERNNELFHINQDLVSENLILQELVCEKFDITPDVLTANIKLLRKEKQVRSTNIRIKEIKKVYTGG